MRFLSRKPRKLSPEELDSSLLDAAREGRTEAVLTLLADGADVHVGADMALRWAARNGHKETVKVLLASGADVHAWDDWALRYAARTGHKETVKMLLAAGADVHAENDYALCMAAHWGYTETVQVLREALRNKHAQRLELERRQNPLSAGTGFIFAKSRLEDMDALLRDAIAAQSWRTLTAWPMR